MSEIRIVERFPGSRRKAAVVGAVAVVCAGVVAWAILEYDASPAYWLAAAFFLFTAVVGVIGAVDPGDLTIYDEHFCVDHGYAKLRCYEFARCGDFRVESGGRRNERPMIVFDYEFERRWQRTVGDLSRATFGYNQLVSDLWADPLTTLVDALNRARRARM